ncbi:Aste57867_23387 [Aphanomyces stellatus]|uniref:Aste57867_23387 protein n=1 Tax=Aphanomyces stellatus TaxID=120398 RepID=A0A485LMQ5_9STRA|nr:hypothetical protein As57867_023316 [Aphanomyces stellatus]VFU00033.1 Aste57867_23387 [Aphanomyces stellatus]
MIMKAFSVFSATTLAPRAPSTTILRTSSAPTIAPALPTTSTAVPPSTTHFRSTSAPTAAPVLPTAPASGAPSTTNFRSTSAPTAAPVLLTTSASRAPSTANLHSTTPTAAPALQTTSASRAPSISFLRSTSAPTTAPALPTPRDDTTTIVVAVVAVVVVLVAGLGLWRRWCSLPAKEPKRTSTVSIAASVGPEPTDSDRAFNEQLERDVNERVAAKLAAAKLAADADAEAAAAEERSTWGASGMWREMGTPTADTCGRCDRAESDYVFVDATSFGMRCRACYDRDVYEDMRRSEENYIES